MENESIKRRMKKALFAFNSLRSMEKAERQGKEMVMKKTKT